MTDYLHWIDGAERAPSGGQWIETVDPFKGDVWARVARGNAADADAAASCAGSPISCLRTRSSWQSSRSATTASSTPRC